MTSQEMNKTQVYLLDDDVYPVDRATKVKNELEARGFKVELFRTFTGLKGAFKEGQINKEALFVMDSTIEEPGRPTVSFFETLPYMISRGVHPGNLMPASGGMSGFLNNEAFRDWLEIRKNYICTLEQMGVAATGMGGDSESVARRIGEHYEILHPGTGEGQGPGSLK